MQFEVKRLFDQEIKRLYAKMPDVQNYLVKHERKDICVEKICEQIRIAEIGNIKMDVWKYQLLIKSMARLFAKTALDHAEERALSDAEKTRKIKEADKLEETKAEYEEDQKILESNSTRVFI